MTQARRIIPRFSWEEGPMQLISSPAHMSDQTIIHNCIIRTLNGIYIQAPYVPMSDYSNFIAYCLAAYQSLDTYLKMAEVMRDAAAQAKLEEWGNWLQSIARKRNNFNPEICRGMMDGFMPSYSVFFSTAITPCADVASFLAGLNKSTHLTVFLLNHDTNFEGGVATFPKAGWWTRNIAIRKKKEWWKFGTVGSDGVVRQIRHLE